MSKRMSFLIPGFCCAVLAASLPVRANDPVSEWNKTAVVRTLAAVPSQSPVVQTRTMAIVQVSVHDAISAITGEYDTYTAHGPAPANASAAAAAIGAAHHALRALFSDHATALDIQYESSLVTHGVSANDPGLDFGRSVAARILSLRSNDNAALAQFDYTVPGGGAPGTWIRLNNAPALLPGWGNVTPFVMKSGSQFRPDPPPALTSERYAKDYNEVKEVGSNQAVGEPVQIAQFWRASPTAIWNGVLEQVLAGRTPGLAEKARAFALLYLAAADSSIACWEAKYHYNFWRPQLAIVNGDLDGNSATIAAADWLPLLPTPPHPEYPSGHTSNSGAMVTVLRLLFGEDPGVPLELTFFNATRTWQTFEQAIDEVIDARIYSGIHYRNSDDVGARLGRQVAHFVMTHALRPTKGSWK